MSIDRRELLARLALGAGVVGAASAGRPVAARAQGPTMLILTLRGGAVFAFTRNGFGHRELEVGFPSHKVEGKETHAIRLRLVSGALKSGTINQTTCVAPNCWDASGEVRIDDLTGGIHAHSYGDVPSESAPGSPAAWAPFGYLVDLKRAFSIPSLTLKRDWRKDLVTRVRLSGGYLRAVVPSVNEAAKYSWTFKTTTNQARTHLQPVTDTVQLTAVVDGDSIALRVGTDRLRFTADAGSPVVELELTGDPAEPEAMGSTLPHFPHLTSLLENEQFEVPARPDTVRTMTPGRFCPGLQIDVS